MRTEDQQAKKQTVSTCYSEGDRTIAPFLLFLQTLYFVSLRHSNALFPADQLLQKLENEKYTFQIYPAVWCHCTDTRQSHTHAALTENEGPL